MLRDKTLEIDETYHVFNRGAHKEKIFISSEDYLRFLFLCYLGNNTSPVTVRDTLEKYKGLPLAQGAVFTEKRDGERLVDILSYALMPNHFHFVVRQNIENGISTFMKKILTGYSMYFNKKHAHSGVVFQGRFQSRHVGTESYFRYIFSYVHLNPVALVEPDWEKRGIQNSHKARKFLGEYAYSSYYDYCVGYRPHRNVLAFEAAPAFLKDQNDFELMIKALSQNPKDGPWGL